MIVNNIWSDNKKISTLINILIFLLSINFLHYGQIILPIICAILLFDNHFKLKVNNTFIFIVLCLFGVCFFAFSYKIGFYSIMGFCIPMAYYIGSNIKEVNEYSIKKVILLIAYGMATHVVLNFINDIVIDGFKVFSAFGHMDIWVQENVAPTLTAVNYVFLIGSIYYLFVYEKEKNIRNIGIVLFILLMIYDIGLGRRTPLFMLIISLFVSLVLSYFLFKKKISKRTVKIALVLVGLVLVVVCVFVFNIFGLRDELLKIRLIYKFFESGLNPERIEIFFDALKIAPEHLWGGREISNSLYIEIHDLWMDIYDFGGIFTLVLFVIYTIKNIVMSFKLLKNKKINSEIKILLITLFICIFVQCFLEPVMSGSTIFLICSIIVFEIADKLLQYNSK